jgi:hypothetical protein
MLMMRKQALDKAVACGRLADAETEALRREAFAIMRSLWLAFAESPAVYSDAAARQLAALLAVEALICRAPERHLH